MEPDSTPPVLVVILFLTLLAAVCSDPSIRTALAAMSHAARVGQSRSPAASAEPGADAGGRLSIIQTPGR